MLCCLYLLLVALLLVAAAVKVVRDNSSNSIELLPATLPATACVILLHGLGGSAESVVELAQNLLVMLPHVRVKAVLPSAVPIPVAMVGGREIPAWFDVERESDPLTETCSGIDESARKVRQLIEHERAQGIAYSRIMLAGFSQGGAMAMFAGLQLPEDVSLAGVVVFSGRLPALNKFKLSSKLPVLHLHGREDPMIPSMKAEMSRDVVQAQGGAYDLRLYEGTGHTVTAAMLHEAAAFIASLLTTSEAENSEF